MQYREIIMDLILNHPEEALDEWLQKQEPLTQVDIMKELKLIAEELEEKGVNIDMDMNLEEFDKGIEQYQEAILDEEMAKLKLDMAEDDLAKSMNQVDEAISGIREYVIECITTHAPNALQMRELANQLINLEKQDGLYKEENWKSIL